MMVYQTSPRINYALPLAIREFWEEKKAERAEYVEALYESFYYDWEIYQYLNDDDGSNDYDDFDDDDRDYYDSYYDHWDDWDYYPSHDYWSARERNAMIAQLAESQAYINLYGIEAFRNLDYSQTASEDKESNHG